MGWGAPPQGQQRRTWGAVAGAVVSVSFQAGKSRARGSSPAQEVRSGWDGSPARSAPGPEGHLCGREDGTWVRGSGGPGSQDGGPPGGKVGEQPKKSPKVGFRCRECWSPLQGPALPFSPASQPKCLARKVNHLSPKWHFYLIFDLCRKSRQKNTKGKKRLH